MAADARGRPSAGSTASSSALVEDDLFSRNQLGVRTFGS